MYDMNNLKKLGALANNPKKGMEAFQALDQVALAEGAAVVHGTHLMD